MFRWFPLQYVMGVVVFAGINTKNAVAVRYRQFLTPRSITVRGARTSGAAIQTLPINYNYCGTLLLPSELSPA